MSYDKLALVKNVKTTKTKKEKFSHAPKIKLARCMLKNQNGFIYYQVGFLKSKFEIKKMNPF